MEDLKTKEEILSEYFLVETEKTEEMKGWKVVGTIEGCAGQSVSPLLELKTDGDGWLCDFKIKLLHCGLVLCSPEYVIDEDDLVMEAMEKVWNVWGVAQALQEAINKQINQAEWEKLVTEPYCPTYAPYPDSGTWTTTTSPGYLSTNPNWSTTITCSSTSDAANYATYLPAIDNLDSAITATCATTAVNDYASAYATACASSCTC